MSGQPNPKNSKQEGDGAAEDSHVPELSAGQKAYERAKNAHQAAKRFGNRLSEALRRLNTSEWITAILTSVIAAATVWNVIVVRNSLRITQGQLDEMRDEKRAWVSLQLELVKPPVSNHYTVTFYLKYTMKNTGNSPAMNVEFLPWSRSSEPNDDLTMGKWIEESNFLCRDIRQSHNGNGGGVALFPGETESREYRPVASYMGSTKSDFRFVIFGCVNYRTVDNIIHQTPFFFSVKQHINTTGYPFEPDRDFDLPWTFGTNQLGPLVLIRPTSGIPSPD